MYPSKAPGPYSLNTMFFQQFWDIVGKDVTATNMNILNNKGVPMPLNHAIVVLIAKAHKPSKVTKFRPISLCNVIYKLAKKVIYIQLAQAYPTQYHF